MTITAVALVRPGEHWYERLMDSLNDEVQDALAEVPMADFRFSRRTSPPDRE